LIWIKGVKYIKTELKLSELTKNSHIELETINLQWNFSNKYSTPQTPKLLRPAKSSKVFPKMTDIDFV